MTKKLTITVSDEVYDGLHRRRGRRKISRFIDDLARRHVVEKPEAFQGSVADAYRSMAVDEAREKRSQDWIEGLIGDALSPVLQRQSYVSAGTNLGAAGSLGLAWAAQRYRELPGTESVRLYVIYEKVKETPKSFPRNWSEIKRQPLTA